MLKQSAIKELSLNELQEKLVSETSALEKLHLNHAVSPLENPLRIRHTRRTIARLKTELNKRNKIS